MLGRRRISAQMLYCLSPEKGKKDSKQRLLTPLKTLKSSVDPLIKRKWKKRLQFHSIHYKLYRRTFLCAFEIAWESWQRLVPLH